MQTSQFRTQQIAFNLKADSAILNPTAAGLFINPIRGVTNASYVAGTLFYNPTTKEICYAL